MLHNLRSNNDTFTTKHLQLQSAGKYFVFKFCLCPSHMKKKKKNTFSDSLNIHSDDEV